MRALIMRGAVLATACTVEGRPVEHIGDLRSALFAGRISGDDENAFVVTETRADDHVLRCTATLLAPRLAVGARHCFLKRKDGSVLCNPDGTSKELETGDDLTVEPPASISVLVGSKRDSLRRVAVQEVVAPLEGSVCNSDIAFLVLNEAALDVRTPLRRAPVRLAETIAISGWGFTNDGPRVESNLPSTRSTRDDLTVTELGPGFIPQGMFAVGGKSLCLGDSGASARVGGAVVGVYSRIDGDPDNCGSEFARNVLQGISSQLIVVERAYEKIGEKPFFIDDLPADGGATTAPGEEPDATNAVAPVPPAEDVSCSAPAHRQSRTGAAPVLLGLALAIATSVRRRRGRSPRPAPRPSSRA